MIPHPLLVVCKLQFAESRKMDYLPKDPAILVSSVNMLLREGRSPRD